MPARLLPVALVLLAGCQVRMAGGGPTLVGSGVAATVDRPIPTATAVQFEGTGTLAVTRGDTPGLSVTWDDNLIDHVVTEVRDGRLVVRMKNGSYTSKTRLTVAVVLPKLEAVTATGQTTLNAEVGGVERFTADASGQSHVTLRGAAATQTLTASGQATVDGGTLSGQTATVSASGQSRVVAAVTEKVSGSASGQASVVARSAATVAVSTSGQASVDKK